MPPESLLRPCDKPELSGDTWRDIADLAARQQTALEKCDLDKRLIKKWSETTK